MDQASGEDSGGEAEEVFGVDGETFKCEDCDSIFKRRDALSRHRITQHPQEPDGHHKKSIKCPVEDCPTEMKRRDHLRTHIRGVHKLDPDDVLPSLASKRQSSKPVEKKEAISWRCVIGDCTAELSRREHLRRHIRRVHKTDPDKVEGLLPQKTSGTTTSGGGGGGKSRKRSKLKEDKEKVEPSTCSDEDGGEGGDLEDDHLLEGEGVDVKEEIRDATLCVLCCHSFYPEVKSQILDQFFIKFVTQVVGNRGGMGSDFGSVLERLSVCSNCRLIGSAAMEKKVEVDQIERKVRRLQMEVVEEMRRLERRLRGYLEEMRRMEEVVKESDVSSLEECLQQNAMEGRNEDNSVVLLLRDGIVSASTQLDTIKMDLQTKLCLSSLEESTFMEEMENGGNFPPKRKILRPRKTRKKPEIPNPPEEPSPDPKLSSPETPFNDEDDGGGDSCDFGGEGDAGPVEENDWVEGENSDPDSDFNISDISNASSEEDEESPSGESGSDDAEEARKDKIKRETLTTTNIDAGVGVKTSKPPEKTEKMKKKKKPKDGVDTTKWSRFKRNLLRKAQIECRKREKIPDNPDPRLKYCFEYNPASDQFSVGSIPVTLHDNPGQESLECSECNLHLLQDSHRPKSTPADQMQKHIQRHHLSIFQCPLCPTNLGSYSRYQNHLQRHQGAHLCQECGKSFSSQKTLTAHHWSKHLSSTQISQLLEQGHKDPRRHLNKAPLPRPYQCSTCGKDFTCQAHLKTHEEIHFENREDLLCPTCGGIFHGKNSLIYHQKYTCFPPGEEPNRVHCEQCPSTFKSKPLLARHMKYVHGPDAVNKPFKCEICGKGFPNSGQLSRHMISHSDARPYQCRNGCGATYKTSKHRSRHEKICVSGGGGGNRRSKGGNSLHIVNKYDDNDSN